MRLILFLVKKCLKYIIKYIEKIIYKFKLDKVVIGLCIATSISFIYEKVYNHYFKEDSYDWGRLTANFNNFRQLDYKYDKQCGFDNIARFNGHIVEYKNIKTNDKFYIEYYNSTATLGMTDNEYIIPEKRGLKITKDNRSCINFIKKIQLENDNGIISKIYAKDLKQVCFELYEMFFERYKNTVGCEIARFVSFPSKEAKNDRIFKLYVNHNDIKDLSCGERGLYYLIKDNSHKNCFLCFS